MHKGRITEPYMLISSKRPHNHSIMQWKSLASMYRQYYLIFCECKTLSCCRPSDHVGNLSHYAEHLRVHSCHSSVGQSNQSSLYMTQRVQYACVIQCIICVYTGTAERIRCVWARERQSVYLRVKLHKYVCIETKLYCLECDASDSRSTSSFCPGSFLL